MDSHLRRCRGAIRRRRLFARSTRSIGRHCDAIAADSPAKRRDRARRRRRRRRRRFPADRDRATTPTTTPTIRRRRTCRSRIGLFGEKEIKSARGRLRGGKARNSFPYCVKSVRKAAAWRRIRREDAVRAIGGVANRYPAQVKEGEKKNDTCG